jgi:hypothetical protein
MVAAFVTTQQRGGNGRKPLKGWTIKAHLAVLSAVFAYSASPARTRPWRSTASTARRPTTRARSER